MRSFGIIAAGAAGLTIATAGQAMAQGQRFETPMYTTGTQSTLDKNYGLPNFGMPGSDLPQQRTMAPAAEPRPAPDFFAGTSDLTVKRTGRAADSMMETPQYTTSEGTTGGYGTDSTSSSETSTPRFGTDAMSFGTGPAR
jgi:hypothetical protein